MWLALASGEEPDGFELVRDFLRWVGDAIADMLYPLTGSATPPVLMAAPLIAVLAWWAVSTHRARRD